MANIQTLRPPSETAENLPDDVCHIVCDKVPVGDMAVSICGDWAGLYVGDEVGDYDCVRCDEMSDLGLCNGGTICDCMDGNESS